MELICTVKLEAAIKMYSERFANLDEVMHPAYMGRRDFVELLQKAIDRNSPLTRLEVEQALGEECWEW